MCLTTSLNLNAKQCQKYMQECGRKVKATVCTRFHNTLWNKIGSDRTSYLIHGQIHTFGFCRKQTLSQFNDSENQIQAIIY